MDILLVVVWILWPIICYHLAEEKGKHTGLAIFGGLVFGAFAVVYYLLCPKER